ncbi:MAG: DUF2470 domain-containing protein [Dongiaceae bacterium]
MTAADLAPAALARRLLRAADRAALGSTLADPVAIGGPYVSLVLLATDHDAAPLLLLSDLAEHSKNIAADPRVALLIDGTAGLPDPLAGLRVTLLGEARRSTEPGRRARFLARHPAAADYAGFKDFNLYRVETARAHLVAGFGRIHWIAGEALRAAAAPALAAAEAGIVEHMNADHAAALDLMVRASAGRLGEGWRMTGIDAEGCDLRRGGEIARLDFAAAVRDPEAARAELIRLTQEARTMSSRSGE